MFIIAMRFGLYVYEGKASIAKVRKLAFCDYPTICSCRLVKGTFTIVSPVTAFKKKEFV